MTLIALALLLIVGVPVLSFVITMGVFSTLLQIGLMLAFGGYLLGIPWAIWFRATKGRWPQY